jgi:hypothetical protein
MNPNKYPSLSWCGGQAEVMAQFDSLAGLTEAGKDLMILGIARDRGE